MNNAHTIAAVATPAGEGGIGIVRLSGKDSISIVNSIFKGKKITSLYKADNYKLNYGHIMDAGGNYIDEVLVSVMRATSSYTREDVVEINCHGGFIVLKNILELTLNNGARLAEPGEFTKRAFLNGRIDLSQAEAVMDVIRAKTDRSLDVAMNQLEGALSREVKEISNRVIQLIAHIEVLLDYPDEDIEDIDTNYVLQQCKEIMDDIDLLLAGAEEGQLVREGIKTAILGKPNVGKSSLLNMLVREERAIVTEIPGTTRDIIEETISIKGIPLLLMDTAGIRHTNEVIEKIGVEHAIDSIKRADLILFVIDSSRKFSEDDKKIARLIKDSKVVCVINKIDLPSCVDETEILQLMGDVQLVSISAVEKKGIQDLKEAIYDVVIGHRINSENVALVTRARHKNALLKASNSLESALNNAEQEIPMDIITIDLKNAADSLGSITGEHISESIIDTIFNQFCVGK